MSRILIGLAAVWFFASGFSPATTSACTREVPSQGNCKPCKRPDGTLNHSPNVTNLVIDKLQLRLKELPPGPPPDDALRSSDMIVNIATHAEDAENDVLDYYYVISAGHIIGSGSNVQWDLNGVTPGTYTITARVDDSCGVCGKTMTQAVMIIGKMPIVAAPPVAATQAASAVAPVSAKTASTTRVAIPPPTSTKAATATAPRTAAAAAPATGPCSCPKIVIADPEKADADLIFTTKIFDLTGMNRLSYIWTVTGGTVVSQDARTIRIKPGVLGGSVTVSVNGLDPKCSCPNQAKKTF
jgi:hypothetical protein